MIANGFEKVAENFNNLLQNEPRGSAAQVAIVSSWARWCGASAGSRWTCTCSAPSSVRWR